MRQPVRGRGRTSKHTSASKHTHGASAKHHPTRASAHAAHHQRTQKVVVVTVGPHGKVSVRTAPLGAGLECCAAEAVAASARLAGHQVTDESVLGLFRRTGPATIPDSLEAALAFGLDDARPLKFGMAEAAALTVAPVLAVEAEGGAVTARPVPAVGHSLILGLELPEGPHAVTVAGDGCWLSWGEHYDPSEFPGAVIEEAWVVVWPLC